MKKKSLGENTSNSNWVSVEPLITDARTANAFLDLAETTEIAEVRSRRTRDAFMRIKAFSTSLRV